MRNEYSANNKQTKTKWLSYIPNEWEVTKLNRVADVIDPEPRHRAPELAEDHGFPYIGIRDLNVDGSINLDTARKIKEKSLLEQENRFSIENTDIVFCRVATLGAPRIIKKTQRVALSATLSLIKHHSEKINYVFLFYYLDSLPVKIQSELFSTGSTRKSLGMEVLRKFDIILPPLSEQKKIANFLTQKTTEIDTLIADKEKLIQLLEEKRQSVITEAVTKGLSTNVEMKNSGIEWLGEIPVHWQIEKYKNLVIRKKRLQKHDADVITAFRDGEVTLRKNRREEGYTFAVKEHGYQQILTGDLVVHQMDAFAGAIGISDSNGKASPVYTVCIAKQGNVHLPYFSWNLKSMSTGGYIQALAKGIRERSTDFRWNDMKDLFTCVPPYREQIEIENFIKNFRHDINILIKDLKKVVLLLKEYRESLIYEVVTGKMDVQEMVNESGQEEVPSS